MAKSVLSENPVRFVRCKVCLIRQGFGEKKLIVPNIVEILDDVKASP